MSALAGKHRKGGDYSLRSSEWLRRAKTRIHREAQGCASAARGAALVHPCTRDTRAPAHRRARSGLARWILKNAMWSAGTKRASMRGTGIRASMYRRYGHPWPIAALEEKARSPLGQNANPFAGPAFVHPCTSKKTPPRGAGFYRVRWVRPILRFQPGRLSGPTLLRSVPSGLPSGCGNRRCP